MTDSRTPGAPVPVTASEAAKSNTIDLLTEHFAQDHLSLEDFEQLVERTHRASTVAELQSVLYGLPTGNVPARIDPSATGELAPRVTASVSAARVKDTDRAVAVFAETKRVGQWIPARETHVVAVMGSAVIDLREAQLGPGRSVFKVVTFFGSVEVIAPPGLYVECTGSAIFGSFEQRHAAPATAFPDAPVVVIDGLAVFGSVEIEFRQPGESKREARRRRRREKREQRRLSSGS